MYQGLLIDPRISQLGVARVEGFVCPTGDHRWWVVTWSSPVLDLDSLPGSLPEVGILPGARSSRSGVHYARLCHYEVPVVAREARTMPRELAELAREEALFEWRADLPFGHGRVLVARSIETMDLDGPERDCVYHYAASLSREAEISQGRLYLRPSGCPRICSPRQPGVTRSEFVYNHRFSQPVLVREYRWGVLGSISRVDGVVTIEASHHDPVVVDASLGWEFFHPRPGDGD